MEPCSGGKAAVLTVLLRLPSGPSGLPPPGQSGQTPKLWQFCIFLIITLAYQNLLQVLGKGWWGSLKGVNGHHFFSFFRTDCCQRSDRRLTAETIRL